MGTVRRFARWAGLVSAAAVAALLLPSCSGDAGPVRSRIDGAVPPLVDVKWVPQYPLGQEPAVFNEPPLRGKVVVLDFYASW